MTIHADLWKTMDKALEAGARLIRQMIAYHQHEHKFWMKLARTGPPHSREYVLAEFHRNQVARHRRRLKELEKTP